MAPGQRWRPDNPRNAPGDESENLQANFAPHHGSRDREIWRSRPDGHGISWKRSFWPKRHMVHFQNPAREALRVPEAIFSGLGDHRSSGRPQVCLLPARYPIAVSGIRKNWFDDMSSFLGKMPQSLLQSTEIPGKAGKEVSLPTWQPGWPIFPLSPVPRVVRLRFRRRRPV